MTNVLGYELDNAVEILENEGYDLNLVMVSSKKGLNGNEKRVIRQKKVESGAIELSYSVFKTDSEYR